MKRILIAAMHSGSGKTVLSCGLMRAFQKRGLQVAAFKCGPDYIDPMFHSRVLGVPSRNLDLYLQGEAGVQRTLRRSSGDLAILEGAMGFYDGIGGTADASAWQTANVTGTPVILALRPQGSSLTLAAQIQGLMAFRQPSQIIGLMLIDCKPSLFSHLRPILERETGLPVLGFLPRMDAAVLPDRHLGLFTAGEIADLNARFDAIADELESQADLDRLLSLAAESVDITHDQQSIPAPRCRIAVAMDEAFSFYYEDNLDALREAGAELCPFSPIHDAALPEADGLYLGGGYPELHGKALSENLSMRRSIRAAAEQGMPIVAECGGFLYLQDRLRDEAGRSLPMVGLLPGEGYPTGHLQRFGYLTLTASKDSLLLQAGESVPAHEFHYWDSTFCGSDLLAEKRNGRPWRCGITTDTLYAAFPHLHWGGELPMARRFADAAARFKERRL